MSNLEKVQSAGNGALTGLGVVGAGYLTTHLVFCAKNLFEQTRTVGLTQTLKEIYKYTLAPLRSDVFGKYVAAVMFVAMIVFALWYAFCPTSPFEHLKKALTPEQQKLVNQLGGDNDADVRRELNKTTMGRAAVEQFDQQRKEATSTSPKEDPGSTTKNSKNTGKANGDSGTPKKA